MFKKDSNSTHIDPNERIFLIPDINNQKDLNEAESDNILAAKNWLEDNATSNLLNKEFMIELHKQMFANVWRWAGKIRTTETNIGNTPPYQIEVSLNELFKDIKYWIKNQTYDLEEIAVRLHYRLIFIHLFNNGNGRHARLVANTFLKTNGKNPLTWSDQKKDARKKYLLALRKADKKDFSALIEFAKN